MHNKSYGDYGADYFEHADTPFRGNRNNNKDEEKPYIGEKPATKHFANLQEVDLEQQLTIQIAEAISWRDHLLTNSAAFQPNEVTNAIKTLGALIANAVKLKEQVQNMARMQAFEQAVVETVKTLPDDKKTEFFVLLEQNLPKA